jgi:hypothetical protein
MACKLRSAPEPPVPGQKSVKVWSVVHKNKVTSAIMDKLRASHPAIDKAFPSTKLIQNSMSYAAKQLLVELSAAGKVSIDPRMEQVACWVAHAIRSTNLVES